MADKRVPSSENYGSFCLLLTFVNGLSLLFYLVSCMSAVEANKVCLAVLLANSSMDMLAYRGQTALLKKTFV